MFLPQKVCKNRPSHCRGLNPADWAADVLLGIKMGPRCMGVDIGKPALL